MISPSDQSPSRQRPPGAPLFRRVNWGGLRTLYVKEVRRFFKVQLQTVWGPAVTAVLFMVIFTVSTGARRPILVGGTQVAFADFLAPGLIMMQMLQNAFANSSFSLLVGKIQGTIVDYLMPPLSTGELLAGLVGGAVTRAFCIGGAVFLVVQLWPGVHVVPRHPLAILYFALTGSVFLSLLGVLTSMWAEKFDHAASVTNFVIAPLSLLSGTFYSIDRLAPSFQMVSHFNPFFYIISGFRYGFLLEADSNVALGALVIGAIDLGFGLLVYRLLARGWRLKS